jgi:hypothetical protein
MNRLLSLLGVAVVMLFGLGACGNTDSVLVDLPLSDDKPTFLFFYTDT